MKNTPPTDDEIRERAYYLWLDHGCPPDRDQEIWFAAQVLLHDRANRPHPSVQQARDARQSDPQHHFHSPAILRDVRPEVARSGAPQRARGRRP